MKRNAKNYKFLRPDESNVADKRENIYCLMSLLQAVKVDRDKTVILTEPKYKDVFTVADEVNIKDKILEIVAGL